MRLPGRKGRFSMTEFERWLGMDLDDKDLTAELESVKDKPEEINDRFYRDLEFEIGRAHV